jgi:type III pantothenate kinase
VTILALDVGNTSVAAAGFADAAQATSGPPVFADRRVRDGDDEAELARWEQIVQALAPRSVVVGAVHRFGALLAERLARRHRVVLHDRAATFPLPCELPAPITVGVDRLAAALAAARLAGGAALCVNAGTAITVDWVDARPAFRGGAIVPGRALQAKALRLHTDLLPEIAPWGNPAPLALPGRTTEEAIRHGLDAAIGGMVDRLLAKLRAAAGGTPTTFVAGGDAAWLSARLESAHRVEPWLVARGLAIALAEAAK